MYHQYFGLTEAPFSIAVNPRYLFMSPRHRDALAHLLYGVGAGGGFILLTGEVGTGKTTINRCLLEQMPADTDIAIILNPALDALELLATVCDELGIDYDNQQPTLKTLTDRLHRFLLQNHADGRKTVLMIDEAQHLDVDVLEQIRLLTNLETNSEKLLQIILIGQPELARLLQRPELRQLNQRITARYNLTPLTAPETAAYIRHRLQVAGLAPGRVLFPPEVVRGIHRITRGIPRLINVLCDRILLGTYGRNRERADKGMLAIAAAEVMGGEDSRHNSSRRTFWLGAGAVVLVALPLSVWWLWPLATVPAESIASTPSPAVVDAVPVAVAAPVTLAPASPVPDPVVSAPAATASDWQLAPQAALEQLWQLQAEGPAPALEQLCDEAIRFPLSCLRGSAETWQELLALQRPLILDLVTPARFAAAALFLGEDEGRALLWSGNALRRVPFTEVAALWRGGYRLLWRPPAAFSGPIGRAESSPAVADVAALFARFDGQPQPLADNGYTAALADRVRLFQREQQLLADGVVGEQTLLRLNLLAGRDLSARAALDLLKSITTATGEPTP
ncbi:general secretion pathway protein GspA [Kineobactrum sediminis]|uniref:General secretion pathway protein GspA n=1 Tax=Kineobactrum sediminis TaxID=1905677 RepID=A0A2N5Y3X2_9GAMM|nr:AAA family ATPase [Kineobactrum sediminis]PLW83068.1 general secretion pathway protein GspA [Kineobactrum sediminis]